MWAFTFWKAVTVDREGFLERFLSAPDSDLRVQIQTTLAISRSCPLLRHELSLAWCCRWPEWKTFYPPV